MMSSLRMVYICEGTLAGLPAAIAVEDYTDAPRGMDGCMS
jgi:hypothetical protein